MSTGGIDGAPCALCGQVFEARARHQRFCSTACRMRARFVEGMAPARSERAPVAYACRACGTLYKGKAQAVSCLACDRERHALVRVVPGPDACVQCLHWVVYPGADYGYACERGRFLECRPHRPGAKPYAPRAGK